MIKRYLVWSPGQEEEHDVGREICARNHKEAVRIWVKGMGDYCNPSMLAHVRESENGGVYVTTCREFMENGNANNKKY